MNYTNPTTANSRRYSYPCTIVALLLLLTIPLACKKKDEPSAPLPAVKLACQQVRVEDEAGYNLFEYNTDQRIIKVATYDKGNTLESTLWTDYNGNKLDKIRAYYNGKTSGTPDFTATATTDAEGNILTLTGPFLGGTPSTASFTYTGRLVTSITRNTTVYRFEYDGKGNIVKTFYKIGNQAEELLYENTYDTQVNSSQNYVALLIFGVVFGNVSEVFSPNNALTQKTYNGNTVKYTDSFVYTYNDKGFPLTVKQTTKESGKPDVVSNTTLQYKCQ
jgi:YD repeat-containing protein